MEPIGIVDIFAGPGGLGEGFCPASAGYDWPFEIAVSVENNPAAHQTLLLRTLLRKFGGDLPIEYYNFLNEEESEPDWKLDFAAEWEQSIGEAKCLTLGDRKTDEFLKARIREVRRAYGDRTVLLGGPPCQAYSLAGRVRNASISGYLVHKDERTRLYEKYIDVLKLLEPAFFVMENVKGMLSATSQGERIFERVLADLKGATRTGYKLFPVAPSTQSIHRTNSDRASEFVVRAEDFGVPQARHRVIILGVRADLAQNLIDGQMQLQAPFKPTPAVAEIIGGLPKLRSGISRNDSVESWRSAVLSALTEMASHTAEIPKVHRRLFNKRLEAVSRAITKEWPVCRKGKLYGNVENAIGCLGNWIVDAQVTKIPNHESRGHMPSDLARYLFASIFAEATSRSPKARDFPTGLSPAHRNWRSGSFNDRFRVQLAHQPATTITSHISKDGHYYIHYDPFQCRSLTVREAARLQTFPDNYLFKGNRTEQYVQVGNAVPPYLARQIAGIVLKAFVELGSADQSALNSFSNSVKLAWG